jgi:hypothetical protein
MDMIPKETLYISNLNDRIKPEGIYFKKRIEDQSFFFIFLIW